MMAVHLFGAPPICAVRAGRRLGPMRTTVFRTMMSDEFGDARAGSIARDHVFAELGGRTADEALAAGLPPQRIWAAVCESFDVPKERR
jgi:Protein of unknown function (DUF3046)